MSQDISYIVFEPSYIERVLEFWKGTKGVHIHENGEDTKEGIELYLERNPGCSFIAMDGDKIIGAILCGHDGRRGFINHLGVSVEYRRMGIGTKLLDMVQDALVKNNIKKGALFVLKDNTEGQAFYEAIGWKVEDIVKIYCKLL